MASNKPRMENPGSVSDTALMMSVGRSDEAALAELYRRHAALVLGLSRRVLRDPALAEDVVQDVFIRLWERPERFDPDRGSLRSFLVRDAHGRAVDRLRSDGARARREQRQAILEPDSTDPELDREMWNLIRSEHVRAAVAELQAGEREAILLAYFGGFTYREVANLVGAPEGTVKTRIRAGLRKLATKLEAAGMGVTT